MNDKFFEGFQKVAKVRWLTRVAPAVGLGTAGLLMATGTEGAAGDAAREGATKLERGGKKLKYKIKKTKVQTQAYLSRKAREIKEAID